MRYKKMSDRARITNLTELIKDSKDLGFDKRLIRGYEKQREELIEIGNIRRSKLIPCVFVSLDKSVERERKKKTKWLISCLW